MALEDIAFGDLEIGVVRDEVFIEMTSWDGWEITSLKKDEARQLRDWLTKAIEHMESKG